MGLSCSHDAWDGAYSAFQRFRIQVIEAVGGKYTRTGSASFSWTYDDEVLPQEHVRGLSALIDHSDCDGHLEPDDCRRLAAALRWLAPRLPAVGFGVLSSCGSRGAALRFADGCERAANAAERLEFH